MLPASILGWIFQSTPYWFSSPPTETCGTSTDSSGSRAKSVPNSFEKSHHVCLMRNVSGRKVLSTAKQVFYFLHVKSFISATSHPGGNCPEGCMGPIPRSPAEGNLFPPTNEFNFGPCHFASGHHSSDLHLPPCCRQPFSSAPVTKAFPFFCPIYYPFPGSLLSTVLLLLFALWHSLSFARDQSLMHWFLPAHWSWPPQSCFQSLNTGVTCDETDSCYPVLRKTFRQSKPITSVTSIAWSHSVPLTSQKSKTPPSSQLCIHPKTTHRDATCMFSFFYHDQWTSGMLLAMHVFFSDLQHQQTELNSKHGIRKFQK